MSHHLKIVSRIKGGLGNQLFCYAAARRLALANDAELVIDDVTGFARDRQYSRRYALSPFKISARKATPAERMEPFERYRRGLAKWVANRKPFIERAYVEQDGIEFDERLLQLKVRGTVYLDGLWQSANYFKDVEQVIRQDLQIVPPSDSVNQQLAEEINRGTSVALHVRWFSDPGSASTHNASVEYYKRAIELIESRINRPRYFLFSDDPAAARETLRFPDDRVVYVSHNRGDENAYADLWLMAKCRHFITANSTFSWWGAWLGGKEEKMVIAPNLKLDGKTAWGFKGLIPADWIEL